MAKVYMNTIKNSLKLKSCRVESWKMKRKGNFPPLWSHLHFITLNPLATYEGVDNQRMMELLAGSHWAAALPSLSKGCMSREDEFRFYDGNKLDGWNQIHFDFGFVWFHSRLTSGRKWKAICPSDILWILIFLLCSHSNGPNLPSIS